ncbi:MAG: glutamate 5-kinase [bacterium]
MSSEKESRKAALSQVKRVVVKVGSGILFSLESGLDREALSGIVTSVHNLETRGFEVVLVSSGAVIAGSSELGWPERPREIPREQAAAAVGQFYLMRVYQELFSPYQTKVAQVLLTHDDLSNRRRYLNAKNTVQELMKNRVLPIINENDTVVVEELKYGDNDTLAALVTNLVEADLLVLLTDVDGLFDANPKTNPEAALISLVENADQAESSIDDNRELVCGKGGMTSKLEAARRTASFGVPTIMANGTVGGIMEKIVSGETVGTMFLPASGKTRLSAWKHWIAHAQKPAGTLKLDAGAGRALREGGKSLLPSGILSVSGDFYRGVVVSCVDESGRELARGVVNYHSHEISRIRGRKSREITGILGYKYYDEVIHRNDLVLI